ncbi:MAG: type II toxin-antitoxin system HicB family antitoxin [Chloroflexi bacterium]|nr:type II toxin-antitoxin system HicB family antitoxin [Chloroflexota bacterium]
MTKYSLYLESGPKHKKTMVHVLDLLGCIAQGPTTEAALESTPEAIRTYLRFLQAHGETVRPEGVISTVVAVHVKEGTWLGNGDPTPGFAPDFKTLSTQDKVINLQRLAWMQIDLLELIRDVTQEQMLVEPKGGGRSIYGILEHMAESHTVYLRYLVSNVSGLSQALKAVQEEGPDSLPLTLSGLWDITSSRLAALTDAERKVLVSHGQVTWSARRAMRRMLEHGWEHLMEISTRLNMPLYL